MRDTAKGRGRLVRVLVPINLALLLVLGLAMVWLNIERVEVAYDLSEMTRERENLSQLVARLEVEHNNTMSPQRLRAMAGAHGLSPARTGQMRRLDGTVRLGD